MVKPQNFTVLQKTVNNPIDQLSYERKNYAPLKNHTVPQKPVNNLSNPYRADPLQNYTVSKTPYNNLSTPYAVDSAPLQNYTVSQKPVNNPSKPYAINGADPPQNYTVSKTPYNNLSTSSAVYRIDQIKSNLRKSYANNTSLATQTKNYGDYGTHPAKNHCKVAACPELHPFHYCKNCKNQDSDHFSSDCPIKFEENKVDLRSSQPNSLNRYNRFDKNYTEKFQQPQSFANKGSEIRTIVSPPNQMRFSSMQPVYSRNDLEDDRAVDKYKSFGKGIKLPNGDQLKWKEISTILKELQNKSARTNLEEALKSLYNSNYLKLSGFKMFTEANKLRRKIDFSNTVLPFMAKIALKLPELFPSAELMILRQQRNDSIPLSKDQVCCLLAHMFFGTISNTSNPKMQETMNFKEILSNPTNINVHKLFCLFNYFSNAATRKSLGEVIYSRSVESNPRSLDVWANSRQVLQEFEIDSTGKIENNTSANTLEVDFANKFIGGGALTSGAVQEEIRFFISPECIPSMLFFESFDDNEVGCIKGTEKVNWCEGYSMNFEFRGDSQGAAKDNIVVMDAIKFNGLGEQFTERNILREVNKAFLGFSEGGQKIITGKWGCGAFKGDPQLKFLIQWMACSEAGKRMKFCSFNEKSLWKAKDLTYKLRTKTVGELMKKILAYTPNRIDLFEYLMR